MRARSAILIVAGTAWLASCQSGEFRQSKAQIEEAKSSAMDCRRDVLWVALERSGNCVAALRKLRAIDAPSQCEENESDDCARLLGQMERAFGMYWRAAIESLYNYGPPETFTDLQAPLGDRLGGSTQYFDLELISGAFENCLAEETNAKSREEIGLWRQSEPRLLLATTIASPLEPGQLCIREGYADPWPETA